MFLGNYQPNLMEKGRIALPKKIRNVLKNDRLVLTIGFDQCIFGFEEKNWEEVTAPELSRSLFSDLEGRDIRRRMFAQATIIELDSQGRFIIPEQMMKFAQIDKNLTIIGAGDHFEIWNSQKWSDYSARIEKNNV